MNDKQILLRSFLVLVSLGCGGAKAQPNPNKSHTNDPWDEDGHSLVQMFPAHSAAPQHSHIQQVQEEQLVQDVENDDLMCDESFEDSQAAPTHHQNNQ